MSVIQRVSRLPGVGGGKASPLSLAATSPSSLLVAGPMDHEVAW